MDSDGDGLPNSWEREGGGIDFGGDGTVDVSLFELGARPDRKDIFLEVDGTWNIVLTDDALFYLTSAFDSAPVGNPNGVFGVNLLIDRTETGIAVPAVVPRAPGSWPGTFVDIKASHFGSPEDRAHPNAANILGAKRLFVRYCLLFDRTETGEGGLARKVYDEDMYVCLGFSLENNPDPDDRAYDDACNLMHELGHLLGLGHGGGDDINFKPNYLSIMNYVLSHRNPWSRGFHELRFSEAALPFLLENNLDETAGFQGGERYGHYFMPVGFTQIEGSTIRRLSRAVPLAGPVDLGNPGVLPVLDSQFTINVIQDLNFYAPPNVAINGEGAPSPGETLMGFDDWAIIKLAPPRLAAFLAGRGDDPQGEPDPPEEAPYLALREFFNAIPMCCPDVTVEGWMVR